MPTEDLDTKKKNAKLRAWDIHYISIYTMHHPKKGKDKGKTKEVFWKKGPLASSQTMAWQLFWADLIRPQLEREGKRIERHGVLIEDVPGHQVEVGLGLPGEDGSEDGDELEEMEIEAKEGVVVRKKDAVALRVKCEEMKKETGNGDGAEKELEIGQPSDVLGMSSSRRSERKKNRRN
jgi:hypothetical protein